MGSTTEKNICLHFIYTKDTEKLYCFNSSFDNDWMIIQFAYTLLGIKIPVRQFSNETFISDDQWWKIRKLLQIAGYGFYEMRNARSLYPKTLETKGTVIR